MIFAAGLGTRLKPLTDTMPKALVRVGGKPLIEHVVEKLKDAGFGRMVVNVHHFAPQVVDYLHANGNFGADIRISDESAVLLDTGGGLKKAGPLFQPDVPVLIHNVDILSNVNLVRFYENSKDSDATLLVSERKTKRYLLFDDGMRLVGWTNVETGEVKSPYPDFAPSKYRRLSFCGIHVISPEVFELMRGWPEKFSIIDFYLNMAATRKIRAVYAPGLKIIDIGSPEKLAEADRIISRRNL